MPKKIPLSAEEIQARRRKILEGLGISPEKARPFGADSLSLEELKKANLAAKVKLLKSVGIDPHMVFLPAFFKKPVEQLRKDAMRLGGPHTGHSAAREQRTVGSAENQRSAEERGKRAVMILEGPPGCLKEVLALPKPDGKALTFRERDAIANSVRRKLFVAAKGDIEEAVRLMLERGFDEVPSRRFIEGLKKRMIQKEKTENESSSS